MNTTIRLLLSLMALWLSMVSSLSAAPLNAAQMAKYMKSQTTAIVYAEKMIDGGQKQQASQLLVEAVKRFPDNDIINALYGQALYDSKQMNESEKYFMKALRLNAANIRAQKYINQIRDLRDSTVSKSDQEWAAIIKDKSADLIVFVLSIWLGTSINSFYCWMMTLYRWRQAKKSYEEQHYMELVRILESHVAALEQDAIDQCIAFMLANGNKQSVRDILEQYVIREDALKILCRSLDLLDSDSTSNAA